jgi:hypothetical protein
MLTEEHVNGIIAYMQAKWPNDTCHEDRFIVRYYYDEIDKNSREQFNRSLFAFLASGDGSPEVLFNVSSALLDIFDSDHELRDQKVSVDMAPVICQHYLSPPLMSDVAMLVKYAAESTDWDKICRFLFELDNGVSVGNQQDEHSDLVSVMVLVALLVQYYPKFVFMNHVSISVQEALRGDSTDYFSTMLLMMSDGDIERHRAAKGRLEVLKARYLR